MSFIYLFTFVLLWFCHYLKKKYKQSRGENNCNIIYATHKVIKVIVTVT